MKSDSILIDEARTASDHFQGRRRRARSSTSRSIALIPRLVRQKEEDGPGDYAVDEKTKQATLTEDGHEKVEQLMAELRPVARGREESVRRHSISV